MKHSTILDKIKNLWPAAFWLLLWQIAASVVGQRLLLVSPLETIGRLAELIPTAGFLRSVLFSLSRIAAGYLAALTAALLLAWFSAKHRAIERLFAPLLTAVRSVPVASFVILALIWIPSRGLSILVSFLIAFPVLYAGALTGVRQLDPKLAEMADVFHMPACRRILYLILPAAFPSLRSAMGVAMGLAWKSGAAAEVIGIPSGSIGEKLYKAKLYLATPDLFAWTLTIVILSLLCEKLVVFLLDAAQRRLERM